MNVSVGGAVADAPREARLAAAVAELRDLLGGRLTEAAAVREHHARGEGLAARGLPDAVAFPRTTDEVSAIARIASTHRLPMVPFGAGTSLEGQVAAVEGGLSVDLSGLDRILEVDPASLDCRVEAGVRRVRLNAHLRDMGLFFPPDPGADATIGGMAATRASGTNAVGYGTMRELVLGLTVVTPSGDVLRTGSRARKSAAGYDLTRLYVGSEGTLGIITEVQLRLAGLPEHVVAATTQFPDLESAVTAASLALQMNLRPARMELLDEVQMEASIRHSRLSGLSAVPTLFLEFHGTPASAREQVETARSLFAECGGGPLAFAETAEARSALWRARHEAYQAVMALQPGKANMGTDACVPIARLVECVMETKREVAASGLVAALVGHVGDGNFHLGILYDPADPGETRAADALADSVAARAIALGGTCSGEHGVGLHKLPHMAAEHGLGVEVMRAIKSALDPLGLMNPGKVLPPA